jgi:hypothetical protein
VTGAAREGNVNYLDPYAAAGGRAVTNLEQLAAARAPTAADLEFDPGYQFRLSEGTKAMERSAAARGTLQGTGTLKALTRYGQEAASQEYANAFDRFMRQQESRRVTLSDLARGGLTAGTAAATNLSRAAEAGGRFGLEGTAAAAGMRTRAAERIGGLGVEGATAQVKNTLYAAELAREARRRATAARTGSQVAASNAFNQGLTGVLNAPGEALSLYSMMKSGGMVEGGDEYSGDWDYGAAGPQPRTWPYRSRTGRY